MKKSMAGAVATTVLLLLCGWTSHEASAQGLAVSIDIDYTPPPGFTPGPNEYRAASGPVVVTCTATGGSGEVDYQWSSTCTNCEFQNLLSNSIFRAAVHSGDIGTHTCTATSGGNTESASIDFNIVGAGIHVFRGAIFTGSQPNNGLVVSDDPGSGFRIRFYCRSDSLMFNIGELIGLDGTTFTGNDYLVFEPPEDGGEIRVENVVGSEQPLPASEQGVYTCRIPLQSGEIREINIGVYPIGFNSAPIISENLFFSPGSLSSTLTCISTASPATTVTFVRNSDTTLTLRDGEEATDANGVTYQLTQTVTNRQQSTYSSILTINQSLAGILGSNFTCSVANVLGTSAVSEQLQIMELAVSIAVDYTPPPGFTPGLNEYRAASGPVGVTCTATGGSGDVDYQWSSTCTNCVFQNSLSNSIIRTAVHSGDIGTHTCTATSGENTGSASIDFNIVGAGIHVFRGANTGSQPNNGLVVSDDPGSEFRIRFYCRSDSLTFDVGELIGLDGTTFTGNDYLVFEPPEDGGEIRVENIVGSEQPLPASEQGVYTCRIPQQSGEIREINIGVYPIEFQTLPTITNPLVFTPGSSSSTLTCTSSTSVATTVTFRRDGTTVGVVRDGDAVTDNGVTYQLAQTLTDRQQSTYENVLTITEPLSSLMSSTFTCQVGNTLGPSETSDPLVIPGVEITSPQQPLTVGMEAVISCSTALTVTSIEWIDSDGAVVESDTSGQQQLNLVFSPVNDSIHNAQYTCRATSNATVFNDSIIMTVEVPTPAIIVTVTPVPPRNIPTGGSYTLTCSAMKLITIGLINVPSLQWLDSLSGILVSGIGITVGSLELTDTTATLTLTFDPVILSHGGQYICQGTLESPAVEGFIVESTTETVNVQISEPEVDVDVPTDPLYTGTIATLNCTIFLDDGADSAVTVDITWIAPEGGEISNSTDFMLSDASMIAGSQPTFQSTLTLMPLTPDSDGTYTCQATAIPEPGSEFITASLQGSGVASISVQDLPIPEVQIIADDLFTEHMLICRATSEEGLLSLPTITWLYSDGTGEQPPSQVDTGNGIDVGPTITQGAVTNRSLTFEVINTSQGGIYTCVANITIPEASIEGLVNTASITINVQSPGPPLDFMISEGTTDLSFSWNSPEETQELSGLITGYVLSCIPLLEGIPTPVPVTHNASQPLMAMITNLDPGVNYSCSVAAISSVGEGASARDTATTLEISPTGAPQSFSITPGDHGPSSRELTFSWDLPLPTDRNGIITSYTISCSPDTATLPLVETTLPGEGGLTVGGFRPFTVYTCTIVATNSQGSGPPATATTITNEDASGPVSNILWDPHSDSSVTVSWSSPLRPNGVVVGYDITLMHYDGTHIDSQNVQSSTVEFSQELEAGVPYNVTIVAINAAGAGEPATITNFTRELIPPAPHGVTIDRPSGVQMTVSWIPLTLLEAKSFIAFYRVFYSPGSSSRKRQLTLSTCFQSPCDVPATENSVLIIGLDSATSYSVRVAAVNGQEEEGTLSETEIAEGSTTTSNTPIIAGAVAVAALLVIGIIVIVLVVIVLRYRSSRAKMTIQRYNQQIRLSEIARTGDPDTIIENIAYAAVDRENVYEVIPGEGHAIAKNVYDSVPVRPTPPPKIESSYEEIITFSSSPPDGERPDMAIKPENKP